MTAWKNQPLRRQNLPSLSRNVAQLEQSVGAAKQLLDLVRGKIAAGSADFLAATEEDKRWQPPHS